MSALYTEDSIRVQTQTGECRIDLCFGDITKLQKKDEVDVLLLSAFPGDYCATPTSLIGALLRNLNLSVRDLARDKAEDLRRLYNCWWSRPLPKEYPFRRILCFESNLSRYLQGHSTELVGDVFRCLVPILNNKDGRVITPLLATGDQGKSKPVMLKRMTEAAVNWMKAGLPLRVLKIVLYTRKVTDPNTRPDLGVEFKDTLKVFSDLKKKYDSEDMEEEEEPTLEYDVYLSFSDKDSAVIDNIQALLRSEKKDVKIFYEKQDLDNDSVWQENMYKVMIKCAKIVTVLSPSYLESSSCTEQYNIALCVNRKTDRHLLAPFYIEKVEFLPTYMGLVQYVDCSPRDITKLAAACQQVVVALSLEVSMVSQKKMKKKQLEDSSLKYDIFISYCHKNTKLATRLLNQLTTLNPDLKIFFDTEELKTGNTWQETLYQAIDGSRCMLACISKDYLLSAVCQEEYNLALAKHVAKDSDLQLIPICIEDIADVPVEYTAVKMVDGIDGNFDKVLHQTCSDVVQWLKDSSTNHQHSIFQKSQDDMYQDIDVDQLSEDYRTAVYRSKHKPEDGLKDTLTFSTENKQDGDQVDIAFSYSKVNSKYAKFMMHLLQKRAPNLKLNDTVSEDHQQIIALDTAKVIVPLVSLPYVESVSQSEELQIALSRHRKSKESKVFYPIILSKLPVKPTYLHLIPYEICTEDKIWREIIQQDDKLPKPLMAMAKENRALDWLHNTSIIPRETAVALFRATDTLLQIVYNSEKKTDSKKVVLNNVVTLKHEILKLQNEEFVTRTEKFLLDCKLDSSPTNKNKTKGQGSQDHNAKKRISKSDESTSVEDTGAGVGHQPTSKKETGSESSSQRTNSSKKTNKKSESCDLL